MTVAAFFITAGAFHFVRPEFYLKIIPLYVPYPLQMVYLSGLFEILFGALILFPKTRRLAMWGLILLLLAVLPANVHMALHPEIFPVIPPWIYWARLPFQAVLIGWVLRCR